MVQQLNQLIPWSSIASIGNSTPARLTALAPLIGYLIIYNQFIAEFFFLSNSGALADRPTLTVLDLLRDLKLTFLYFGLVFFGVGAILFAAFAPRSVRKYKTPEEYVLAMGAAQTEWLIVDNLTRVGSSAWGGDWYDDLESYGKTSLSFTEDTLYQLDAILEHAGHNAFDDEEEPSDLTQHDPDMGFYNAMGNVMTDRVLECILSKRRVDRALWHNAIGVVVDDRARDVFYMAYSFDEWSKFGARLSCSIMFAWGGALLSIPTIITSVEVVSQIGK
jgi:predicted membrane channel-forming protein YqfA (hemolysin III family)